MMRNSTSWTPQEDQALRVLYIDKHIKKWSKISQILSQEFKAHDKNAKKCRERYNNHLNPHINRQQWTKEEENLLMIYQSQMGNKWAEISRQLPGRTDNFVKNKFYSKLRLAARNINKLSSLEYKQKYKQIKIGFIYKIIESQTTSSIVRLTVHKRTSSNWPKKLKIKSYHLKMLTLNRAIIQALLLNYYKMFSYLIFISRTSTPSAKCRSSVNQQKNIEKPLQDIEYLGIQQKQQMKDEIIDKVELKEEVQMIPEVQARQEQMQCGLISPLQVVCIKQQQIKRQEVILCAQIPYINVGEPQFDYQCAGWLRLHISTCLDPWGSHYFQQSPEYDSLN